MVSEESRQKYQLCPKELEKLLRDLSSVRTTGEVTFKDLAITEFIHIERGKRK